MADSTTSGAICNGVGTRYHVRMRPSGARRYVPIGKPTVSYGVAVRRLGNVFSIQRGYERGVVLMTADYYDPVQVCEISR